MAAIVIKDLPADRTLDRHAMSAIQGGGAPWVFGWIQPYVPSASGSPGSGTVVNFFEINNNYFAEQMNNQFQTIDVKNYAPSSMINLAVDQRAINIKQ